MGSVWPHDCIRIMHGDSQHTGELYRLGCHFALALACEIFIVHFRHFSRHHCSKLLAILQSRQDPTDILIMEMSVRDDDPAFENDVHVISGIAYLEQDRLCRDLNQGRGLVDLLPNLSLMSLKKPQMPHHDVEDFVVPIDFLP